MADREYLKKKQKDLVIVERVKNRFLVTTKKFDPDTGDILPLKQEIYLSDLKTKKNDLQSQINGLNKQIKDIEGLIADLEALPGPAPDPIT